MANGVAFTCMLFALSATLPVAGAVSAMLVPLPLMFYRTKRGRGAAAAIAVIAFIATAMVMGAQVLDAFFLGQLLVAGLILGELIQWRLPIEHTVALNCLGVLGIVGAALGIYSLSQGIGLVAMVTDAVRGSLEATLVLYKEMGMSAEYVTRIEDALGQITYVIVRVTPSLMVSSLIFISWANLVIARPLFASRNLPYPDFGRLNRWAAPDFMVWLPIASGMALMLPAKWLKIIGINGLLVASVVYFFQGIAIVSFFFEAKRFPKLLRVMIYALIAVQQILALLVIGLGLFDMWLDLRKLKRQ
ncbi:MAG: YybS family protein [Pseudomonadota bacterium]